MPNSRIMLTLAGVFLAGVGTGMMGMRYVLHDQMHPEPMIQADNHSAQDLVERFRTQLKLTPEQAVQLTVILRDWQQYYQAIQETIDESGVRAQIEDVRSTGKNRILQILNPEQRKQFEKMTEVEPAPPSGAE